MTTLVREDAAGVAGVRVVGANAPRRPRRRRRLVALVLAAVIVLAAVGVIFVPRLLGSSPGDRAAERRAVSAYGAAVRDAGRQGGRVVVENVKPRLTDLELGQVSPEQFRYEAPRWTQDMERVRAAFAAAHPPSKLRRAAALYDQALRTYEEAFDAFVGASYRPKGEDLNAAVSSAAKVAERADTIYEQARALVDREWKRVGLPENRRP